jgi:hypothetical protein
MGDKPAVRCLVVKQNHLGRILGKTEIVPLEDVPAKIAAGFSVVGPDPADLIALALWEKGQAPPFGGWLR